jgi:hypothetical protein
VAQARTVHGEIAKVREGMDANRNEAQAIRGEIAKLTIQLELQNSKLDFQTKMQNQVFAVQNTKPNAFNYFFGGRDNCQTQNSGDLPHLMFLCFRRGCPPLSLKPCRMDEFPVGGNAQLKSELAFRDRLSNRIHELTRVKSRFEFKKEEDANWMIHHS